MEKSVKVRTEPQTTTLDNEELAYRSFTMLRGNTAAWRIDAQGLWSYPALASTSDGHKLWLTLICGVVPMPKHKKTAIFRPKTVLVTKAQLPYVIRYESWLHGHDPFPNETWDRPVAMYPHKAIGSLTPSLLARRERELCGMYPAAQDEFSTKGSLPPPFKSMYLELTHPVFLRYLNALTPAFVQALEVA